MARTAEQVRAEATRERDAVIAGVDQLRARLRPPSSASTLAVAGLAGALAGHWLGRHRRRVTLLGVASVASVLAVRRRLRCRP